MHRGPSLELHQRACNGKRGLGSLPASLPWLLPDFLGVGAGYAKWEQDETCRELGIGGVVSSKDAE